MRSSRIIHTTTFRLSAFYVVAFAAAVAALGAASYLITAHLLETRLNGRIEAAMEGLQASYRTGGVSQLSEDIAAYEETHPKGALDYALLTDGQRVAGHLTTWPSTPGWSDLPYRESDGELGSRRFLVAALGGHATLAVAADPEQVDEVKQAVFGGFASAFGTVLLLGSIGGVALSLALIKRVEAMRRTVEAIIAGDLTQRIPVRGSGDDLDRLSQTLNHMLDRIGELVESLREVSANIAHDLKTPLARLRQRLEAARTQPGQELELAMQSAIVEVDGILATFSALLRIAQIEAGSRRAGFAPVELSEIFATVADAFAPVAEDAGQILSARIEPDLRVTGDQDLLMQMLVNVVENAIRHTSPGARISVELRRQDAVIVGIVSDTGPGVPATERERIFRRFHRLPQSRAIPGSGLGLSLVKAVADIHQIGLATEDAGPGLRVSMRFTTQQ